MSESDLPRLVSGSTGRSHLNVGAEIFRCDVVNVAGVRPGHDQPGLGQVDVAGILEVEPQGVADQVRADPAPGRDVFEGLVDDADNGLALDGDADHRGDVLNQVLGVLLRRVERVDPDCDVIERDNNVVLDRNDVVDI